MRVEKLISQFIKAGYPLVARRPRRPRPVRGVRVKDIKPIVFPDGSVGIKIITSRGAIYLPPVVEEGRIVPLPKKHAQKLSKIAPEVIATPRGVYP